MRKEVERKRKNKEIDVNSCLQLLMDVTTDMLDSKVDIILLNRKKERKTSYLILLAW